MWIPNTVAVRPAWKCARTDCDKPKQDLGKTVRRWCAEHSKEWDKEASEAWQAARSRDDQYTNLLILASDAGKMPESEDEWVREVWRPGDLGLFEVEDIQELPG